MGSSEFHISALGEEWVGPTIDSFFDRVLDTLGYSAEQRAAYCQLRVRELPTEWAREGEPFHPTDDRITELLAKDQTIATALEIRNSFNFSQILLADYLTPELIQRFRETT